MRWWNWTCGFVAGAALASWLTLSCAGGNAQTEEVADALHQAAVGRNVSEAWLRRITWCESRWTPWVTSRGGHMGLAQFAGPTWRWMSAQAGHAGESAYEPYAAADTLAWALAHNYAGHWACR